jgi:C_GCAxxG_C_C family probable redox protein
MTHEEKAVQYYEGGYLCSQAVLAAYAEEYGLTEEQALKLGTCLGAGMRKGEVCGACTGALMVLGLMHNDPKNRKAAYENTVRFLNGFRDANGSYLCNDLLGCDVRTPEGVQYARDHHLFTEFCPKMVESAVEILEEILAARKEV